MDAYELGWAAGFFDGEGCIYVDVRRDGLAYVRVSIDQRIRDPLDKFKSIFQTGGVYGPFDSNGATGMFVYRANGNRCRPILEAMQPYLVVKQAQVVLALTLQQGMTLETKQTIRDQLRVLKRPWLRPV